MPTEASGSHWHDADYSLDPHNLRVRANLRHTDVEGANSGTDAPAAGIVPRLLSTLAPHKRTSTTTCCVDACGKDLSKEKEYYQRYRICEEHLRLLSLSVDGKQQRFCQQCGRFHPLADFDDDKRSCRAKLEEHNNRRRKRQAQDDAQDRVEAKPTRSRRKALVTAHVPAVKAKRAPRRKKPNALVRLLPDDKPTSSSSAGVQKAMQGSDTSTAREASSNSERATGSQEMLPTDRGWASVNPSNSADLVGRSTLACNAMTLNMADDALGLTGVEELMTALAPADKHGADNRPNLTKTLTASSTAPVTSTPWESQGSLWDLQQPSDLETFYCQLKNSASSSDHHLAAGPLPELDQTDVARRDELAAIQHHLTLSEAGRQGHARQEDLLAIQHLRRLSDPNGLGAARTGDLWAAQSHVDESPAQAQAALLPNRQGYQLAPETLPSLTSTQVAGASAGLLSSPSSSSSQVSEAQHAQQARQAQHFLHAQQAQRSQQAQHAQLRQQQQPAAPWSRHPSLLQPGSEDAWQAKGRQAPAVIIEELPAASQPTQEDNMLQAMRIFFGGTLPGGRVAPDDTPFVSQSPMAIAPLHTMTGSGSMAHDAPRKDVTASFQNLKAQNACSMLPVQLPQHRPEGMTRETTFSPFQTQQAAQKAAALHGQYSSQLKAGHAVQHPVIPHDHSSASYNGCVPLPLSTAGTSTSSGSHAEHMPTRPPKRLSVSGSIGNFLSKHNFLTNSAGRSLRSCSNSISSTTSWHPGPGSTATGQQASADHVRPPMAAAQQHASSTGWGKGHISRQAAYDSSYGMPPAGLQEGTYIPGLPAQGIQHRVPGPLAGQASVPALQHPGPEHPSQHFGRVNLKLSDQTPASIPVELLPHILAMTSEQQVAFIEGHMRAGCVHLVFDIFSHGNTFQWDIAAAAARLMAFDPFWRRGSFFAQTPGGAVKWQNGRITNAWEGAHLYSRTPLLQLGQSVSSAACIVSGRAANLFVTARSSPACFQQQQRRGILASRPKVLARYGGKFVVNPDLMRCTTCADQLSTAHLHALQHSVEAGVMIPGLEGAGVLHLEAEEDGFLSTAQPVVVAPDQEVQQDVCKLVQIVQAAGASREKINRTLEDIGLVLQYQDHMLDWDDNDSAQGPQDHPPDWESGWADNLLLSRRDSAGSELLDSDNSTHCGVLSAAASAVGAVASHSSASFRSDDDAPSLSGTSSSIQGLLQSDSVRRAAQQQSEYLPFTHPTYIAHVQHVSTKMASICRLLALPALAQEMAAVSSSMQLNDDDILNTAQPDPEPQDRRDPPRSETPSLHLPTIDESSHSPGNSSPPASARASSGALSSRASSRVVSEFAFDTLDVPDVIETSAPAGEAAVNRQVDKSGQAVITVVLSEEERQLKDSAKEMHEQSMGKKKADLAEAAGRPGDQAQEPLASVSSAMSSKPNTLGQGAAATSPAPPASTGFSSTQQLDAAALNNAGWLNNFVAIVLIVFVAAVAAVLAGQTWLN